MVNSNYLFERFVESKCRPQSVCIEFSKLDMLKKLVSDILAFVNEGNERCSVHSDNSDPSTELLGPQRLPQGGWT